MSGSPLPFKRTMVVAFLSVSAALIKPMAAAPLPQDDPLPPPTNAPQEDAVEDVPEIPSTPTTVDPASLMPKPMAKSYRVEFKNKSLRDLVAWLEEECGLVVILEQAALNEVGILPTDPYADQLNDEPLYLLLNRLQTLELAWYFNEEILHITSAERAESRQTMVPYNIGDLLDKSMTSDAIADVIQTTIDPDDWQEMGGVGVLNIIGDVVFIRHNDNIHRKVRGLLTALRKHGRRTYIFDPPQHAPLREKMAASASVALTDMPLVDVIAEIATVNDIDLRLDPRGLAGVGIRGRRPVSIHLRERKLNTILDALLSDMELTTVLRDGVLWVTSQEAAEAELKTAVFDVRDLCRDTDESSALQSALTSQTCDYWDECGGIGTMSAPLPGILVIYQTERVIDEVTELLEAYRAALRGSKRRGNQGPDPKEVITVYYRLHTPVAAGLKDVLPLLVQPSTWKSAQQLDAPGEMILTSSTPEAGVIVNVNKEKKGAAMEGGEVQAARLLADRSVLIIKQTRECHEEIEKVIMRVQMGDSFGPQFGGGGLGGVGGGGFGGGFFNLPDGLAEPRRR